MSKYTKTRIIEDNWFEFLNHCVTHDDFNVPTEVNFWRWFIGFKLYFYSVDSTSDDNSGVASPLPPDFIHSSSGVANPKSPEQVATEQADRIKQLERKKSGTEGLL